jgi:alanine racemase
VHCDAQIDMLSRHKTQQPQRVFLKMNSGMNRLGFAPGRFRAAWSRLNALPQVDEVSLMTHFSDADGARGIAHQTAVFAQHCQDLPGERSLANSAALLRHHQDASVMADWVRPGIALYGSSPDHPQNHVTHWGLRPTMSLRSQLIGVQTLAAGDSVGYASTYRATTAQRMGVVACGYADGYPRLCPTGTPVLVSGVPTRTLGRVSMDMIAVDLEPVIQAGANAQWGATVTLWGQDPSGAVLPIDEPAAAAGTIGYELMCALAARVPVTTEA